MDDIDAAFDDAFRTHRIEAGDDPSTLPNPYSRPSLIDPAPHNYASSSGGGGFIPDDAEVGGGGFIVDDDDAGGGGFIPDDSSCGGGFILDDEDNDNETYAQPSSSSIVKPSTISLSCIPEALANLGLDSTDPSVLSLFAETAYTPSSSRRRLPPGVKAEKVVGRQEFQQVASVLLEERRAQAQEEDDREEGSSRRRPKRKAAVQGRQKAAEIVADEDGGGGGAGGFIVDDGEDSEDDFGASRDRRRRRAGKPNASLDTGSDLTGEEDEDEYDVDSAAGRNSATRRRRRPAASPSPAPSLSGSDTTRTSNRKRRRKSPGNTSNPPSIRSTAHLNPLQRDNAQTIYSLLLSHLPPSSFPPTQRRIGITELTSIIQSIGEKIPPKEIEEMIEEGSKLFAPALSQEEDGATGQRKSAQAIKGVAAAQGIIGEHSIGLEELAGILVHNRLL
ncbi:uncharacterized protein UTRI_01379_B [Ustilago trichophora]|uniref:Uncharacterized protein n=1 Tax=Ustilago trichophora TaxID=86804 RepID=A0A5C3E2C8_9BASI|nr:uncharacterized protein UTRI_01379_B [Ustilago trichophora]